MAHDAERADVLFALKDQAECRELIASYGPAVDWIDSAKLLEIFWPGATVDLGPGFFTGPVEDYVAIVIEKIETTFLRRMHNPGAVHIRIRDDKAEAENAAVNQTLVENSDALLLSTFTGRYLWKIERRFGRWGIASMKFLLISAQHTRYDKAGEYRGLNLAEDLALRTDFFH
jgi:hypothetical protein